MAPAFNSPIEWNKSEFNAPEVVASCRAASIGVQPAALNAVASAAAVVVESGINSSGSGSKAKDHRKDLHLVDMEGPVVQRLVDWLQEVVVWRMDRDRGWVRTGRGCRAALYIEITSQSESRRAVYCRTLKSTLSVQPVQVTNRNYEGSHDGVIAVSEKQKMRVETEARSPRLAGYVQHAYLGTREPTQK